MGDATKEFDKAEADAVTAEDLDLISSSLEDDAKDDKELWNEIDDEETAAKGGTADEVKPAVDTAAVEQEPVEQEPVEQEPVEQEPVDKPEVIKDDDIWAGASPEQRAAFEAAQTGNTSLQHQLDSDIGRTKTFRRQLADVTGQLDRVAAKPPTEKDDGKPADSVVEDAKPDNWDALSTEYPEIAGPVGERLAAIEAEQNKQAKKDKDLQDDASADHTRTVETQTHLLEVQHSDWLDVANTHEFGVWIDDQPRATRDIATRNAKEIVDAKGAGDLIARYKASRSEQGEIDPIVPDDKHQETVTSLAAKRKRQLESSAGARPRGPSTIVQGLPEDGTDQELWDGFDKMDEREAAKA